MGGGVVLCHPAWYLYWLFALTHSCHLVSHLESSLPTQSDLYILLYFLYCICYI